MATVATQTFLVPALVDESTILPDLLMADNSTLVIDLKQLQMMNSAGIRLWIRWLLPLSKKHKVVLSHCPMIFLNLSSIVLDVVPEKVHIQSFSLNYLHETDDREVRLHFSSAETPPRFQIPEAVVDDATKDRFEFDGLISKTFARFRAGLTFIPSMQMSELQAAGIQQTSIGNS